MDRPHVPHHLAAKEPLLNREVFAQFGHSQQLVVVQLILGGLFNLVVVNVVNYGRFQKRPPRFSLSGRDGTGRGGAHRLR